jgi:chemotaxis protein methyltransferase CheR
MTTNPTFEFEFTDDDFNALRGIVTKEAGIQLPDHKKQMMYSRLARRIRDLDLDGFAAYRNHVEQELRMGKDEELLAMINAMTTNVTAFFREKHHFEHLSKYLAELVKLFGPNINIWSSACSTGEEPWSIAMTAKEFMNLNPGVTIKIWATDLDTIAKSKAEAGVYSLKPEFLDAHPLMKKYLSPTPGKEPNKYSGEVEYRIIDSIRPLIQFKQMNLLKPWPMLAAKFHVVFCRNVIIYFDKETQRGLFAKYHNVMPPKSVLYLGHSESLHTVSDQYELVGTTTHIRKEQA